MIRQCIPAKPCKQDSERNKSFLWVKPAIILGHIFCLTCLFGGQVGAQPSDEELDSEKIEEMIEVTKDQYEAVYEEPLTGAERLDELNRSTGTAMISEKEQSVLRIILWYIPNRIIDLADILKLDIGAGGAVGGVVRATRYGQLGYRHVGPISLRLGARGRELPFFIERHTEYGFGGDFQQTPNRKVTPYEVGIGLDAGIGAYAGVSFDELFDFFAGFLLFDPAGDDLVH